LWGIEPSEYISIDEDNIHFLVDVRKGHKTGFYLDQRENRTLLHDLVIESNTATDNSIYKLLNVFSYTGGFSLQTTGDTEMQVTSIDVSHEALELAEVNVSRNPHLSSDNFDFIQADAFDYLRDQSAEGNQWDVVVLDPPKFAHSAGQVEKAARGYKDINLNAFKCVKPGGYLMTFSCSGAVSADLFQKIVFGALADSGRQAQILKHLGPGDDHPVALTFPEGAYLKGLLLRVY
jgi:23S rRNA (cytosine1962-C5)-methyltransferase